MLSYKIATSIHVSLHTGQYMQRLISLREHSDKDMSSGFGAAKSVYPWRQVLLAMVCVLVNMHSIGVGHANRSGCACEFPATTTSATR
jgi:hypothetical protein